MEFLARIEEYFTKHRGNRWRENKEVLDESFKEIADNCLLYTSYYKIMKQYIQVVYQYVSYSFKRNCSKYSDSKGRKVFI